MKIVIIIICVLVGLHVIADDFVITENGKSKCEIIADDGLSLSEKQAVKELKYFIKKMSGAQLKTANSSSTMSKIIIGIENANKLHPDVDTSGLGDEGYVIATDKGDLILAGGRRRGTLYAIYTLLDRFGYKWLTPSEADDIVPDLPTMLVKEINLREMPHFKQRNIMYANTTGKWCARNKINKNGWGDIGKQYGGSFPTAGFNGHNLFRLLKTVGVKAEGDMLALWKGKRGTGEGKRTKAQLCLTNSKVLDALARAQVKIAKTKPGVTYVKLAPEDNMKYCQCDHCAEVDKAAGTHTGQLVYASNYIAKRLAKEAPGTSLMFSAYTWHIEAPKNMPLEDNIIVSIAPIEGNYMRPFAEGHTKINANVKKIFKDWSKLTNKFFVWDYVVNYSHYNAIFPNLDVLVPNIKFYKDNNVTYLMEQAAQNANSTEFAELRRWVLAKGIWNPEVDNKALISEFLKHYYGAAAPAIQKYIDATHKASRTTVFASNIYDKLDAPYLQAKYMIPAELAMREAEKLAKGNPLLEKRVRLAHLPLWYLFAHRSPQGPFWKAMEKGIGEKINLVEIAKNIKTIDSENKNMRYSEWEKPAGWKAWVDWLQDYAAQCAKNGMPIPAELKNVSPNNYYVIQACQMDSRPGGWQKMEGASDGWGARIATNGWTIVHHQSVGEEHKKDQAYDVFVRIKTGKKIKETGNIFTFGERSKQIKGTNKRPDLDASLFEEDKWYTVKLGTVTNPQRFFFAANKKVMDHVNLDCYWMIKK